MRFVIVKNDYPDFLSFLYSQNPGLESKTYDEQLQARADSMFGLADFYSTNLRQLGHEAYDLHFNNQFMQRAWVSEHGGASAETPVVRKTEGILDQARRLAQGNLFRHVKPLARPLANLLRRNQQRWLYQVLAAQIRHYRPDVLINVAMDVVNSRFFTEMRPHVRFLIGQIAAPLPKHDDFRAYDLVISSLPNFVEDFRRQGLHSEWLRLGFEPRVLSKLKERPDPLPISFVGSLSPYHQARTDLLEYLCGRLQVQVWGPGIDFLPAHSNIRRCHRGDGAWGIDMYQILHASRITINQHIGIAASYANNLRLYEATGVGAMLITDWKVNLQELFEPGREVIAYRTPEECAELIQYYLEHETEREEVARAGQQRTLQEHTYHRRMQELSDVLKRYL